MLVKLVRNCTMVRKRGNFMLIKEGSYDEESKRSAA